MRLFPKRPPYTKRIAIEPPAAMDGRAGCAIVTHLKNEASYIAEWALFHKAIGVRHFFVYDHGSTDGTPDLLRAALPGDRLTVMPWALRLRDVTNEQALNSQTLAFAHAILNFGGGFRWMAMIDADEFLLPRTGRTIDDALEGAQGFPNISLPWHMFGTGGHKTRPEGPVTRNYTMRAADPLSRLKNASNFKCIVDPCAVCEVSIHHFQTKEFGDLTANDTGRRFPLAQRKSPEFYSAQYLQLNHYYTKSEEEMLAKIERGVPSATTPEVYRKRVMTAKENIEKIQIEDDSIVEFIERNEISISI